MILGNGSKVLVVHRRLLADDHSRYFVGTVLGYEGGIAKVQGHTFIRDAFGEKVIEKLEVRTKVFSMASGTLIVYELPIDLELEQVTFNLDSTGSVVITDGLEFSMDLSEVVYKKSV